MNLLVSASSFFGYLGCVEDETFVRGTRNKFLQLHITLFTKYLTLYNN